MDLAWPVQVVRIKEVFDVSYAAQRDMVDGFQPVLSKNTFALGGVGGSSLLGKRQSKAPAKSTDAVSSSTSSVGTVSKGTATAPSGPVVAAS